MTANSEILSAARTESIQDVGNVAVKVLRGLLDLLKQSQRKINMYLNGRNRIETKLMQNVDVGMKEIWKKQEKCLLKLPENITKLSMDAKNEIKDLLIGRKITPRSEGRMIEPCTQSKQESLLDRIVALSAKRNVNLMRIMKITQSLWMSLGSVLFVTSTYIMNQNITLNDLAGKLQKEMRKSEHIAKVCEGDPKRFPRLEIGHKSNRKWQAGGKSKFIYLPPGYNNDPCMLRHTAGCSFYQGELSLALNKSSLIEVDVCFTDNTAQAKAA